MSYNLLEEEWIPVLYRNGEYRRVGILKALEEAHLIRQIAESSPFDTFAITRFILTLLYWKSDLAGGTEKARHCLLKGSVPHGILQALDCEQSTFDLFQTKKPFLQDGTLKDEKPTKSAGSFFAEFATGTNVAHFHHGDDAAMRLCLPCTAIGLLRVIPLTQAGGAGLSPSIHGAPPILALGKGPNLAVTLGLNFVPLDVKPGKATWTGTFNPGNRSRPVPYMEALTWNPRRIYLGQPAQGLCWRCGLSNVPTIGKITYKKNEQTTKGKDGAAIWNEPAAFYSDKGGGKTSKSIREASAASSTDIRPLVAESAPKSLVVQTNPGHDAWQLIVPCTNPANNKTFDHRSLDLAGFSVEEIRRLGDPPVRSTRGFDGWTAPIGDITSGHFLFVNSAASQLTHNEWLTLSSAAFRQMHESPAAFDICTGILWPLRGKGAGLPSKSVAWLILKLMAHVPARYRSIHKHADFCPLRTLHKRQPKETRKGKTAGSLYPLSLPHGIRLEFALRQALTRNIRKRSPQSIDWVGLCWRLNHLVN